jgi:hypothetical protein
MQKLFLMKWMIRNDEGLGLGGLPSSRLRAALAHTDPASITPK